MDAFGEDDDPMGFFTSQQDLHHRQQQQNELRRLPSSSSKLEIKDTSNIMGNGELLEDDPIPGDHEQGNARTPSSSPPNNNLTNTNNTNTNTNANKLMLVDQADSKEASKDAGSWSTHATAVLLDVFRDKRVAINGRNFRGEEWEELAAGVNERCQSLTSTSTATTTGGPSRVEPWKNAKQCSYKMSNLKRKYKSERELQQLSSGGAGMSSWQWFAKMDAIFGSDPKYTSASSFGCDDEFTIANLDNSHSFKSSAAAAGAAAAAAFASDLPTSKSASTNNLDGCSPSPRPEAESSPRSDQLLSGYSAGKQQQMSKNKRQCIGVSSPLAGVATPAAATSSEAPPPGTFGESMKLLLVQQKEMLQLLRELVTSKPQLQRHDQDLADIGAGRDVLDLKLKIESADRELSYLKQVCESKEKELKDAVLAYEDKNRLKNELVGKLVDAVHEKELSKLRRLVSMDRNLDSMLQQQQQQHQHQRHDHRL